MQLFVKRVNGGTLVVDARAEDSVGAFMAQLQDIEGLLVHEQSLVFQGRQLDAGVHRNASLASVGVQDGSTLHLLVRLRGGADEFEKVNPITQKVLDGLLSRRSMGTVYKWLKYEDLDPHDILGWKKSIQGLNSKGQLKWDFTMPGHLRFQSLSKGLNRVAIIPDRWKPKPRDPSICNFIHEDKNEVRWICNNQRATHPVTGKLFDKCGWHTLECIGKHNDHDRPRIEFPNADGLCKAHFFAKHTDEPPQVAFLDTPGIAILNPEHFKAHMKRAKLNEDHDSQGELFDEDMTFDDSTQYTLDGDDDDTTTYDGGKSQEELMEEEIERQLAPQDYDDETFDPNSVEEEFYDDELDGEELHNLVMQRSETVRRKQGRNLGEKIIYFFKRFFLGKKMIQLLQRVVRGFKARQQVRRMRELQKSIRETVAAQRLQKIIRGRLARRKTMNKHFKYTKAAASIAKVVRAWLRSRRKLWLGAALTMQRIVRGHWGRERARIARFRVDNMREYWVKLNLALALQRLYRGWEVRASIRPFWQAYVKKRELTGNLQKYCRRFLCRCRFVVMRDFFVAAAVKIQCMIRSFIARQTLCRECVDQFRATTLIQRTYRGYKFRLVASIERAAILKAWKWLNPRDAAMRAEIKANFPNHNYLSAGPAFMAPRPYWQNTRENQIKDLMHTAFPRRKVELLPLDMQELLDMTEEERQKKEKYDSEMKEYKRILKEDAEDRKETSTFQGDDRISAKDFKRIMVLDDELPELPAGVRGIVLTEKMADVKIKSTIPKPVTIAEMRRKYRKDIAKHKKRAKDDDETKNLREIVWDSYHSTLELARSEEDYQKQFLFDPNSTLTDFIDTFKITRPIPLVEDGRLTMSLDAGSLYLKLLEMCMDKELDLATDEPKFVQLCMNVCVFLDRHWKKLLRDLKYGTLDDTVPVSRETREAYLNSCEPRPHAAYLMENVLRRLGFHRRAAFFDERKKGLKKGTLAPDAKVSPALQAKLEMKKAWKAKKRAEAAQRRREKKAEQGGSISDEEKARVVERPGTADAIREIRDDIPSHKVHELSYDFTRSGKSHRTSWIEAGTGRFVGRFVCTYPNCGRAFTRQELADSHALNFHAERSRAPMRRSLPQLDQYLAPFWPEEAPFLADGKEVTGTYERKRLERLRAEAHSRKESVQAKQRAKEEKLRRLWKLENGLEDDSDSDEDDAYGFASQPSRANSRGSGGGGSGGRHNSRRGMTAPNGSNSVPPIVAGPPASKDGRRKMRDRGQYIGRNGKKPTSWTTGMLWSEHYNQ